MASVDDQLAALATMSPAQLRSEWQRLTSGPLPRISPSLLRLALAWEIQAKAYGGLSRTTQQKLDQQKRGKTRTSPAQPGMRLVREWNGKSHHVDVVEGGFVWNGGKHRSLSAIAREITGARWSGPRFFGL